MENLDEIVKNKRQTTSEYEKFFSTLGSALTFIGEPNNSYSNYWLNCIKFADRNERDIFLEETNANVVITRPIWRLMNKLEMYKECQSGNLDNALWLEVRVVNIPSSIIISIIC